MFAHLRLLYPEATTRRHLVNKWHEIASFAALWRDGGDEVERDPTTGDRDPRFEWLWRDGRLRSAILSELGRLQNHELIRNFAIVICEKKWPTAESVARLRQARGLNESQRAMVLAKAGEKKMSPEGFMKRVAEGMLRAAVVEALRSVRGTS